MPFRSWSRQCCDSDLKEKHRQVEHFFYLKIFSVRSKRSTNLWADGRISQALRESIVDALFPNQWASCSLDFTICDPFLCVTTWRGKCIRIIHHKKLSLWKNGSDRRWLISHWQCCGMWWITSRFVEKIVWTDATLLELFETLLTFT